MRIYMYTERIKKTKPHLNWYISKNTNVVFKNNTIVLVYTFLHN